MSSSLWSFVTAVASTLSSVGILAGVGYLRGISRRLNAVERKLFRDELHLLDHERRLDLTPKTPPRRAV